MDFKPTFNFNDVYYMTDAEKKGYMHVSCGQVKKDTWLILKGQDFLLLEFQVQKGSKKYDFISSGYPEFKLISDRFCEVFKDFKGWKAAPIKLIDKDGQEIPGYSLLQITGKCGPIVDSKSILTWRPTKANDGKKARAGLGLYFDPKTWDGSDFFCPENKSYKFVTRRVKERAEKEKLTNFSFEAITEIENPSILLVFEDEIE